MILILVLMVAVVVFSLANAAPVPFHYFVGRQAKVSLALIIIISALAGAIGAVIAGLSSQRKLNQKIYEQEQQLRGLGREKAELADDVKAQRLNHRRPRRPSEE
ncbi:MAG: LapA family protein [Actinomycetota bacterium]|nr:LapA family protein [Actinomycetota bacterium]